MPETTPKDYRGVLQLTTKYVYKQIGEKVGWADKKAHTGRTVRTEIAESVVNLESGGDPDGVGVSPDNARGMFQVVPGGQEASWWEEYTGNVVNNEYLDITDNNMAVGIAGLGLRMDQVSANGHPDWFTAGVAYFGCQPLSDGSPDPNCGDIYSNGAQYQATLERYVQEQFGPDTVASLHAGKWAGIKNDDFTDALVDGVTGIPGKVGGAVVDPVVNGVLSALNDVYEKILGAVPRIGIALAGVGLLLLGVKGLL
jgi:hypothetical protein